MTILMPGKDVVSKYISDYFEGKVLLRPIKDGFKICVPDKILGLKYMKSVGVIIFNNKEIRLHYSQEDFERSDLNNYDSMYGVIRDMLTKALIGTDFKLGDTWTSYNIWKKYNRPNNYTFMFVKSSSRKEEPSDILQRFINANNNGFTKDAKNRVITDAVDSNVVSFAVGAMLLRDNDNSSAIRDIEECTKPVRESGCHGGSSRDSNNDSVPTHSSDSYVPSYGYGRSNSDSYDSGDSSSSCD